MANQLELHSEEGSPQKKEIRNRDSNTPIVIFGIAAVLAILCGLAAIGIFSVLGRSFFEPKVQVILEPDVSRASTVHSSDLETAARILNARCRSFGCRFSFVVANNNQIIAQVPASTDIEAYIGKMISVGLLEFVDFGDTPVPTGTRIQTDFGPQYFAPPDEKIWHTVMTNDGFKDVSLTTDALGQIAISFTLTSKGTKKFSDYTTNNIARYLGVVLDKTVISAPRVNAPITDGLGIIQGHFTKEEAQILASFLKTGEPLPIPLIIKDIQSNSTQIP